MLHYRRISSEGKCFVKTPLVSGYDRKTEEGAIMRQALKFGASYDSGNGKNAKLEVIAAVLMKIQIVWDMIP
jgi:hypothetical protein